MTRLLIHSSHRPDWPQSSALTEEALPFPAWTLAGPTGRGCGQAVTVLCDKSPTVEGQAPRRGTSQAGVPDGGKEDARPRGGPGSWLPSPRKEVPWWLAVQPRDGGGGKGAVALPAGPPFWGILALVHRCLICMAIHPRPSFPATPEPGAWSLCQAPRTAPPQRKGQWWGGGGGGGVWLAGPGWREPLCVGP